MTILSKSPHRAYADLLPDSKNNLEYDLRTTDWILAKVREDTLYAQHLYAAMCNNSWVKTDLESTPENLVHILSGKWQPWSCSWRYAGGIVADMREEGDYLDWYCSGIVDDSENTLGYADEGSITDQIKEDLKTLGWRPHISTEED